VNPQRPAGLDGTAASSEELKNIQDIVEMERQTLGARTRMDRVTDAVVDFASRPAFILLHLLWFAVWLATNTARPGFDPYPYSFLTVVVSLEAIVLTGFVLMAQSRMTHQADRRAHLDLQVNLLAERELTAILKVQCLIAERLEIDIATCDPSLEALLQRTDVRQLAGRLNKELARLQGDDATAEPTLESNAAHAHQ
jgi:uncharacterized membrane protein